MAQMNAIIGDQHKTKEDFVTTEKTEWQKAQIGVLRFAVAGPC
jgi:hypothetical protein